MENFNLGFIKQRKNVYIYTYIYIYIIYILYVYIYTYTSCTEEATEMAAKYLHNKNLMKNIAHYYYNSFVYIFIYKVYIKFTLFLKKY